MVHNDTFFSIAPMMGKTDSFFCYLISLIKKKTVVYTEMMHAEAIIRTKVLDNYNILNNIDNVVVQIAGSNPHRLALAAKIVSDFGFEEININCGCPSKRVVSGKFGINLLLEPSLVRKCVEEINKKTTKKISIKTRIGVDHHISESILDKFVYELNQANVKKYIIHARKAIRIGLSTKDNLNIPQLDYKRVYKLKKKFKSNHIIINGGFKNTDFDSKISNRIDGIMIGREAYKNPWIFNSSIQKKDLSLKKAIIYDYLTFLKNNFNSNSFNKTALMHIQNIFSGYSGSKKWKFNVSNSIKNRNLNNLLKILDYDRMSLI